MSRILPLFALAGALSAQSITEVGAAAAGGATGGAAGKQVSSGITKIFGKIDQQTATAAKTPSDSETKPETAKVTGASGPVTLPGGTPAPGAAAPKAPKTLHVRSERTEKDDYYNLVPPPPPIQHAAVRRPDPPAKVEPPPAPEPPPTPVVVPPPPPVTAEDLRAIAAGANREDVLKIGQPASRITMFDDGHLSETYRYAAGRAVVGMVHLSDGVVTAVDLR